ncbi:glycosyltransferase [Croceicoccus pelagius]|uniref:Glycosyl transferase n=1 Tax=Croceicoccus pelagius TaxID=1703341 RepID=A0A916Y546_9SPHN|nr:glycosyltransferase [Croceicoccus pelagius]GGD30920.1 glycosyl transferase [Croceicoccus pelagius]
MKRVILHVSHSDRVGGAAIAARRLVEAQRKLGLDAHMLVIDKRGGEGWINEAAADTKAKARAARFVAKRLLRRDNSPAAGTMRTAAVLPTGLGREIAGIAPDVVHLHWLGSEAISVRELGKLALPTVWTCHDQWAFCGTEHYAPDEGYRHGYKGRDRFDADVGAWKRKKRHWRGFAPTLACPSRWMADCAARSDIAGQWPSVVIPNTLDTSVFSPLDRDQARKSLGLPEGELVLFGADAGDRDRRKGYDLLLDALAKLRTRDQVALVTFGGAAKSVGEVAGLPCHALGKVSDPAMLTRLYSAADLFVVPSRADNLPNTMVEAQCCGTRSVGFDVGGLGDIVSAPHLGELVPAFDTGKLAAAIDRQLAAEPDRERIRTDALAHFGNKPVVDAFSRLYDALIAKEQGVGC